MNAWDKVEQDIKKKDAENGKYIKLADDGDKIVVVFLGYPTSREVCFEGNQKIPLAEARAKKMRVRTNILINVAIYGTREVKVLEKGPQFFKDLLLIRNKYGLEKWAFEVRRNGVKNDPKTTYSILPERQLTPEEQAAFKALELHDLEKDDDAPSDSAPAPAVTEGDYNELLMRLKPMPRDYVDRFLRAMKVTRIREIDVANMPRAKAYVNALENELRTDDSFDYGANVQEADPFA